MTNLTVKQLKTQTWGTPCGTVGQVDDHLSHPLFIDFVETFFDGVLNNVETDVNDDDNTKFWLLGGQPTLKKLTITNDEFDKFATDKKQTIADLSHFFDIKKKKFQNVENDIDKEIHPEIISWLFSELTGMRADYMSKGDIDIESE